MNFEELQDKLIPILQEILVLRLPRSRSWNNVSLETGKRYLDITWCDAKDSKPTTQTKRIQPFNAETLCQEVATQWRKLQEDSK